MSNTQTRWILAGSLLSALAGCDVSVVDCDKKPDAAICQDDPDDENDAGDPDDEDDAGKPLDGGKDAGKDSGASGDAGKDGGATGTDPSRSRGASGSWCEARRSGRPI